MKLFIFSFIFSFLSYGTFASPVLIITGADSSGQMKKSIGMLDKSCLGNDCFIINGDNYNKTTYDLFNFIDEMKKKIGTNNSELTLLLFAHGHSVARDLYDGEGNLVASKGEHYFQFGRDNVYSADLFSELAKFFKKVNAMMLSCYSGACVNVAVNHLPQASRVFTTSSAKEVTSMVHVLNFFQELEKSPSSLKFEDLVIRFFLDGTYLLREGPQLLKAGKNVESSVTEALVGKIGEGFSSEEKEKVLNKLTSYLSRKQIEQAIASIESGEFVFYDEKLNHRLAVIYSLAEDFEFDPELIKRGKRNLTYNPLPFRYLGRIPINNSTFGKKNFYLKDGQNPNRFYVIFGEDPKRNEYNVFYRKKDEHAKHSYSYIFKTAKFNNNVWVYQDAPELNLDYTKEYTKLYKKLNRAYPVEYQIPADLKNACKEAFSLILRSNVSP